MAAAFKLVFLGWCQSWSNFELVKFRIGQKHICHLGEATFDLTQAFLQQKRLPFVLLAIKGLVASKD